MNPADPGLVGAMGTAEHRRPRPPISRRTLLAGLAGGAGLALSGCLGAPTGPSVPVVVVNRTAETKHVRVEAVAASGSVVFDRRYALPPGTSDETGAVDAAFERVHAAAEGVPDARTAYDPPAGCPTSTPAIRVVVRTDAIGFGYDC